MKKLITTTILVGFIFLLIASFAQAEDENSNNKNQIWIGSHYTEFDDYGLKIGEYERNENEFAPEFTLKYILTEGDAFTRLYAHYYDDQNFRGKMNTKIGDRFQIGIKFTRFLSQKQQDLLENVGAKKGPKMLSHEMFDEGAGYSTQRNTLETDVELLLSKKYNVRLMAAHRSVVEKGTEQKISETHCFSCHLASRSVELDRETHQVQAGISAEVSETDLSYAFTYRQFKSNANPALNYWDRARHPIVGDKEAEFSSRLIYDDTTMTYSAYPETEKMQHKVKVKRNLGKGRFMGAFTYGSTKNKITDLKVDAYGGAANYSVVLNRKTRFVTKLAINKVTADDPFLDFPVYRDGRPGDNIDFDYIRYSTLDRTTGNFSAELMRKVNNKLNVNLLAGYKSIDRADYPLPDEGLKTTTFYTQGKIRYRKGLRYSTSVKYRYEKISDQFISGRGLFEARMREAEEIELPAFPFIFYHEREAYRYQDISAQPTQVHKIDWTSNWRPTNKLGINLGIKATFDKNTELDSLDVEHSMIRPNLSLTYTPDAKMSLSAGLSYTEYTSRGPITVALFDG